MYTETSRYKHSEVIRNSATMALSLDTPPRIPYLGGYDEIAHIVREGDTLQTLAALYYKGLPAPATLWWAIADFQPEPINDPTIALAPGDTLIIPSIDVVQGWVMDTSS